MKFECSVVIKAPKDKVVALFQDPTHYSKWQDGFISITHKSGEYGKEGAKSDILYKMGKGTMHLEETIIKNALPDEFVGFYKHKSTENTMKSTFTSIDKNTTEYRVETDYTAFKGFIINVIAVVMPGMFRKQVLKWVKQFRDFVESEN